jgi:hypothetical protein
MPLAISREKTGTNVGLVVAAVTNLTNTEVVLTESNTISGLVAVTLDNLFGNIGLTKQVVSAVTNLTNTELTIAESRTLTNTTAATTVSNVNNADLPVNVAQVVYAVDSQPSTMTLREALAPTVTFAVTPVIGNTDQSALTKHNIIPTPTFALTDGNLISIGTGSGGSTTNVQEWTMGT